MKGAINYPVGDFLIRLKNAVLAKGKFVEYRNTKQIREIANCLFRLGFLDKIEENKEKGTVSVYLKYAHKLPVISDIKLISKPGLRVYWDLKTLERYKKPQVLIISTPKGILSSKEALKERVGGEIIASVW